MPEYLGQRHVQALGHPAQAQALPSDLLGQVQRGVDDALLEVGFAGHLSAAMIRQGAARKQSSRFKPLPWYYERKRTIFRT